MAKRPPSPAQLSRRNLAKGIAWTAPALVVATAAPAVATSLRIDPGINGWVLNSPTSRGFCRYYIDVDSTVTNTRSPDGAPFGLYLYDIEDGASITGAKLTYWIIGDQEATWTRLAGHSGCWGSPVRGTPSVKADGLVYTPYTWTYSCAIDAAQQSFGSDGVRRLWLGHFRARASFTQSSSRCSDVTYWTQRTVTVDRDGAGGRYGAEVLTFERRNGTRGVYAGAGARSAGTFAAGSESTSGEVAPALS